MSGEIERSDRFAAALEKASGNNKDVTIREVRVDVDRSGVHAVYRSATVRAADTTPKHPSRKP